MQQLPDFGDRRAGQRVADNLRTPAAAGLAAIESGRIWPTKRVVFDCAKILNVVDGAVDIETADGTTTLTPGMSLALGTGRWCKLRPRPSVRMWTVYLEEQCTR